MTTARSSVAVSVGIPCYNRPDLLERAVKAVQSQTHRDLEIVISDNASTDPRVEEFCRAAAEGDPRIIYIRRPENIGAHKNFSAVLEASSKPYFMWAADDDWLEPNFIELCLAEFSRNPKLVLVAPEMQLETAEGPCPYFPQGEMLRSLEYRSPGQYTADSIACLFGCLIYGLFRRDVLFHHGHTLLHWYPPDVDEVMPLSLIASKGPICSLDVVAWHKRTEAKRFRNFRWASKGGWRRWGPALISPGRSKKWVRHFRNLEAKFESAIGAMDLSEADKQSVRKAVHAYCSRSLRDTLIGWKPRQ